MTNSPSDLPTLAEVFVGVNRISMVLTIGDLLSLRDVINGFEERSIQSVEVKIGGEQQKDG